MNPANESPVAALAAAIEETAFRCAEPLQQWMNFATEEEQKEKWLQIVWEHVFLFMHLVNRNAYGTLDDTAHGRLMGELAPHVVMPLAQELAEGRPDGFRQQIVRGAFEGLNRSEQEYAECAAFLAEPVLTGTSVVSVFLRKVGSLAGGSLTPAALTELLKRTVEAYKSLTLKDRIAAIAGFMQSEGRSGGRGTAT